MTAVIAIGGHWLLMLMCCFLPLSIMMKGSDNDLLYAVYLELGLTPPAVAYWAPFREFHELKEFGDGFPGFAVLGMFVWCVAAAAFGSVAHERFRRLTHRNEWIREPAPAAQETVKATSAE
jgi:hypothetical protein